MDSHYILVGDDCDQCSYIAHAFTLVGLPLKKFTDKNVLDCLEDISHATATLFCKHIEESQGHFFFNHSELTHSHFISFNEEHLHNNHPNKMIHYMKMPFTNSELSATLSRCQHFDEEDDFTGLNLQHPIFERLLGHSPQIRKIRSLIKHVACSDSTVLILGQSGTGKDVIASCIHFLSNRRDKPLVPINCGAIPSELMESELFGHEKGAFTGALTKRPGRFEMADGGTLFLDEIGDMPFPMQVKLLRVLQERKIERVGGSAGIKIDVRLIAATNKNLEELILHHQFREDLYYRLNVFPIQVPNLNERVEDIPALIDYHLDKIYERLKHRVVFTDQAKEILCHYSWPGNIRELENFLERMVILHHDRVLDEKDIEPMYRQKKAAIANKSLNLMPDESVNIKEYIANIEKQMIQYALDRSNGIVNAAAKYLSMGRTTFLEKMKKYDLINAEEETT